MINNYYLFSIILFQGMIWLYFRFLLNFWYVLLLFALYSWYSLFFFDVLLDFYFLCFWFYLFLNLFLIWNFEILAPVQNQPVDLEKIYALVLDLINPEKKEEALLELSKRRETVPDLAPILWHSFGIILLFSSKLDKQCLYYPFLFFCKL